MQPDTDYLMYSLAATPSSYELQVFYLPTPQSTYGLSAIVMCS